MNLLLFMGVALFLPNMSFRYGLAWLYLAVFFLSVAVITIYIFRYDKGLLGSRLAVGPVAEQRIAQKVIQGIASLLFIAIFVLSSFDHRFGWSYPPPWLSYVATGLIVVSFVLLFRVFRENTFLSATIQVQEGQAVVSTGLYGVVRHPMYSGAMLLMLFTPIALGSFWGVIPALLLLVVIVFRAVDEERVLMINLEGYAAYCQKVKYRFIPYLF